MIRGKHHGRPRDPSADERIRAAAAELLLEHGVDGTTVDAVAERAGVGKATVYRRWPSKEDLALAAFDCVVEGEIPQPDTGSFVGDLTQIYTTLISFANSPDGTAFFRLMASESARDPRIADIYRCALGARLGECSRVFDAAVQRGELHPDADRGMIFEWPVAMIMMRVVMGKELPTKDDAAQIARATVDGFAMLPNRVQGDA